MHRYETLVYLATEYHAVNMAIAKAHHSSVKIAAMEEIDLKSLGPSRRAFKAALSPTANKWLHQFEDASLIV